jgi:hypothetical protein
MFRHMHAHARLLLIGLIGCSTKTPDAMPEDAGSADSSVQLDAGTVPKDGGSADSGADGGTSRDAAPDAPYAHRYGDGGAGSSCELNRNCANGLRCECNGNCACKAGARGNGRIGDPCTTGEDCGSSICINDKICSDECSNVAECKPAFTKCLVGPLASVKICAP